MAKDKKKAPPGLTNRQSEILTLRQNHTNKEVADMLGVGKKTVAQIVYQARQRLRAINPDSPILQAKRGIVKLLDKSVAVYQRALDDGLAADDDDKALDRSVKVAESILKGAQVLVGKAEVDKTDVKVTLEQRRVEIVLERRLMEQFGVCGDVPELPDTDADTGLPIIEGDTGSEVDTDTDTALYKKDSTTLDESMSIGDSTQTTATDGPTADKIADKVDEQVKADEKQQDTKTPTAGGPNAGRRKTTSRSRLRGKNYSDKGSLASMIAVDREVRDRAIGSALASIVVHDGGGGEDDD